MPILASAFSSRSLFALLLLLAAGVGLFGCAESEEEIRAKQSQCRQIVAKALSDAESDSRCRAARQRVSGLQRKKSHLARIHDGYRSGRRRVGPSTFLSRVTGADRAGNYAAAQSVKRDIDRVSRELGRAKIAWERRQLEVARTSLSDADRALVANYLPMFFDEKKTLRQIRTLLANVG